MRIGIAYCGGCNPRFDRVEAVAALKEEFPGIAFLPFQDGGNYDFLAVVCGCHARCAARSLQEVRQECVVLTRHSDFEVFRHTLENLAKKS